MMIQCRLRELMAEHSRQLRKRVTYNEIYLATGISQSTLSRLANDRATKASMSVVNRLCGYFECQPGDLFVYEREPR